jgi:hypothetical protein
MPSIELLQLLVDPALGMASLTADLPNNLTAERGALAEMSLCLHEESASNIPIAHPDIVNVPWKPLALAGVG